MCFSIAQQKEQRNRKIGGPQDFVCTSLRREKTKIFLKEGLRQISYLRLFVLFLLLHRERQKSRFFKQDFKRAASGYGRYRLPSCARNSRFIFRLCRKLKLSGISANEFHLSISLSCALVSASFKTFSKSFSFFSCILTLFPADFFTGVLLLT